MTNTFKFISLSVFIAYLIFNFHGTQPNNLLFNDSVAISFSEEMNEFFPSLGEDKKNKTNALFKLSHFIILIVLLSALYHLIPTWYFMKKLLILTPLFFGSEYLIHAPL